MNVVAKPWLSVLMPSYRGEEWINASLNSVASEGADGIEILLIDSGPTRHTADIARGFSDRLNLRVFDRSDLSSWHSKTNFGVEASKSTHICWLGVDDLWLPGRAAAVRTWIDAAPQAALQLAPSEIVDKTGRTLGVWRCPLPANCQLTSSFVIQRLLVQNFIAAPAPIFRKDAWLRCGGLDEGLWYSADWDMWLKLASLGPVYYRDDVSVGFRIHSGSLTTSGSRNADDFAEQMLTVLNRHLPSLGDSRQIERAARASISVNSALAAASTGDYRALMPAALQILRLGPSGVNRYLRDSRILDRALPRVRAKLYGTF